MKKTVVIASPVGTRSGYGARGRDLAVALINSEKYDVKVIPIPWGSTPNDALDVEIPEHKEIVDRIITQVNFKPDIFIHHTIPVEFNPIGEYNIGVTVGIETNMCKPEWLIGCNKMDLVLTSSEHSKRVFEETSFNKTDKHNPNVKGILQLETPVEVLFEGINLDIYKKNSNISKNIQQTLKDIKEDFCFLFVGHWLQGNLGHDRKDVGMLVKVFCDAFKTKRPSKRPALILKTSGAGFSYLDREEILKKLYVIFSQYPDGVRPNVYLLHGDLTDEEMNDLYNHPKVKAMVSFTKGEGFGRPLLEFTTTGKPVIASKWSGQLDFLSPKHSVLLDGDIAPVHPSAVNEWIMKESKWFNVDYATAAFAIYKVFNDYEDYLEKSKNHIPITKKNFSLQMMESTLIDILNGQRTNKLPKLKKINLPTSGKSNLPKLKKVER